MTSEVDICNLALLRLGTRSSLSSFTEGSVEANACAQVYALMRDMLLASHQWDFATRRVGLADLGSPPVPWDYRYAYPVDCLRARSIRSGARTRKVTIFEISGDVDADGNPIKVILCNLAQAELTYTAQIVTPDLFPPHFVEALSWMVAAEISTALSSNDALTQYAMQMAAQAVSSSKANDANQSPSPQEHVPDWVSVRGVVHADPYWSYRT